MEAHQATSGSAAPAVDLEDTECSVANQNPHDSGTREDVALSSGSGREGCPSEDSDFSCDEDRDAGALHRFASSCASDTCTAQRVSR